MPQLQPPFPDRRQFLGTGLAGAVLAALGLGTHQGASRSPRAVAVIHVHLDGGLSHLDTFDPKPFAPVEVRGPFGTVPSSLDREPLSNQIPRLAKMADRLCIIRSVTHGEAAHERGSHSVLTGYPPSPAITYPSLGSVAAQQRPPGGGLPAYVCIPRASEAFLGPGYLGPRHAPFSLGGEPSDKKFRVQDLVPEAGLDARRIERRRSLLRHLDEGFEPRRGSDTVQAFETFYQQAFSLMDSPTARNAFDMGQEPAAVRQRFGDTRVGQRLLLARRLAAAGVRWTTVVDNGYDHHDGIQRALPPKLRDLDLGLSALIHDLEQRGELDRTLVLVTTEFGRTSRINPNGGRDHWPKCFSVVMAGGGLKRGAILGRSDGNGAEPEERPVSPADLAATAFHLMGLDLEAKIMSPGNRPIDLVRGGHVLKELLA